MEDFRFSRIRRESITSRVYEHIKAGILHGALPPGTHMRENQIAEQMGVSRSPVREAFRLLEADHMIESRPNQGVFVRSLTDEEVWEIYTARSVIEGFVAGLAATKAAPEEIQRLRHAVDRVNEAARREDFEATVDADFEVHRLIWQISRHAILAGILSRLEVRIRMFMAVQAPLFEHLLDSVKSHESIFQAIANGDQERARQSMQEHIIEAGTLALGQVKAAQNDQRAEMKGGASDGRN
jgi:DNA-binding GntR family transcriptional regulator